MVTQTPNLINETLYHIDLKAYNLNTLKLSNYLILNLNKSNEGKINNVNAVSN